MAHQPEEPDRYVCEGCQAVYAGTARSEDGGHSFEAPVECAACGSSSFVEFGQWTHHSTSDQTT